jgi:hypothetical protein
MTIDEAVMGQQKLVIFLTLERDTTNFRGALVENVKKRHKSTLPTVYRDCF